MPPYHTADCQAWEPDLLENQVRNCNHLHNLEENRFNGDLQFS